MLPFPRWKGERRTVRLCAIACVDLPDALRTCSEEPAQTVTHHMCTFIVMGFCMDAAVFRSVTETGKGASSVERVDGASVRARGVASISHASGMPRRSRPARHAQRTVQCRAPNRAHWRCRTHDTRGTCEQQQRCGEGRPRAHDRAHDRARLRRRRCLAPPARTDSARRRRCPNYGALPCRR